MKFETQLAGEYTITRRKADTLEEVETLGPFKNIIVNGGLNRMGLDGNLYDYCYVGSGSTAPAATQTSLVTQIASTGDITDTTYESDPGTPYVVRNRKTFRFPRGAAAGNLAEVGVGWGGSSNEGLFSRARILDTAGQPTTITVLADEVLDVNYTLAYYPRTNTDTVSVTISGVTYSTVTRLHTAGAYQLNSGPQSLAIHAVSGYGGATGVGPATGFLNGELTGGQRLYADPPTYVNGSYKNTTTVVADENSWNDLGTGLNGLSLETATYGAHLAIYYQVYINPPIPKDATKRLTLNFEHTWTRYTPP